MTCTEMLRTQNYLDGELDGAAATEAERHIASCAECQAQSADTAHLSDALRWQATRHLAPPALRDRIAAQLDAEPPRKHGPGRRSFWFGAASGAGASALAAALVLFAILPPSAAGLAQSVTDAHIGALMNGRMIAVISSNHHTVKPWFAGKVAVSPPVADFAKDGFILLGGRVDDVAGTRAAVVVYRHGGHEIDLFAWPDRGARLPGDSIIRGYRSAFWKSGDLDFAAVSDMEKSELQKFVTLVRAEPE